MKIGRILHGLRYRNLYASKFIGTMQAEQRQYEMSFKARSWKGWNNIYRLWPSSERETLVILFWGAGLHFPSLKVCCQNEKTSGKEKVKTMQGEERNLQNIPGSGEIDMSQWRTAAPNKLCFKVSICNKVSVTWVLYVSFQQCPAAQTTEALRHFRLALVVTVFQKLIIHSKKRSAEIQEDAQNGCSILHGASEYA